MMKALQVTAPGEFTVVEAPVPEPGPGEVLLKVEAVTTCPQWDLHLRHNEPMFAGHQFNYPYTVGQPGHEATGTIERVGAGVEGLAVGDRVSAWRDAGHDRQGCYAQYVVHHAGNVIKVPPHLSVDATAPLELAMCVAAVFLMLNEMNAVRGRTFGIAGLGPAGLIAIQMAKAEGAQRVIGFDLQAARHDGARLVGADAVYDPRSVTPEVLPARPGPTGMETSIDCVGAKAAVEFLMDRTSDVVALFGVQREAYTFDVRHYAGLRLCGYKGHSREAAEYALGLIERGALDLTPLVSRHLPLEQYNEGIELLERQEAIKVCFRPWW